MWPWPGDFMWCACVLEDMPINCIAFGKPLLASVSFVSVCGIEILVAPDF